MANSSSRTAGDTLTALQFSQLRDDILSNSTGHKHTGQTDEGAELIPAPAVVASRPAAGTKGKLYKSTDVGSEKLERDNGSTWDVLLTTDAAVGVASLRTLGTGALQASAGTHGH